MSRAKRQYMSEVRPWSNVRQQTLAHLLIGLMALSVLLHTQPPQA